MNICFMLGGFHQNGGIGRVTSMLANRLADFDEFNITTLSYVNTKLPNLYEVSDKIYQEFFLSRYQSMGKLMLTGGEKKLRNFLVKHDIDVLIACGALFYPICVRASKKIKTKCICWEHSNPEGNSDHRGQNGARKYGIKRSDLNVVLTKSALAVYKDNYHANRTMQIYNPIDEQVFKYTSAYNSESKKIISVGRLSYQKYFEKAVDVASRVLPSHPEWIWDIYGNGEEFDSLNQLISDAGLSDQMHLCGQVDDLYERYKNYALMVMTSRYEGFPMTLLEGNGNALPLISFDIPTGPNEIIEDGGNGYLIKAFDSGDMAQKLSLLIMDTERRGEMSNRSKELCSRFAEKEILGQWQTILNSLK